jgi:hypothetical protein
LIDIRVLSPESAASLRRVGLARQSGQAGAAFSLGKPAADTGRAAAPFQALSAARLDALLALQIGEEAREKRRRGVQRGRSLLDALDALKLTVLQGHPTTGPLTAIAGQLQRREPTGDPVLEQLLDEVELRASVELAKHGHGA